MLNMLDRRDDAIQCYDKALALRPHLGIAKLQKATVYLSMGRFAEGWELYESRWDGVFNEGVVRRYYQPRWDGEPVKGSLLIWGEQGVGDCCLFAGMIPDLKGCADTIWLEVEPRLVTLFQRSFPHVQVIANGEDMNGRPVDAHESLAGLGKFFRSSWGAFPRHDQGYLRADDRATAELRARVKTDGRTVVGLAWRSVKPAIHEPISAPLRDFEPFLRLPGCRFVDLQYGDTRAEREAVAREIGIEVEHMPDVDAINDIDRLAALVSACDVVITTSNSSAHIAGALGKPTWVMVPYSKSFIWHWFKDKQDSPWYPRVRVRHQQREQSWPDLIRSVSEDVSVRDALLAY
jgi:hypothetical protein